MLAQLNCLPFGTHPFIVDAEFPDTEVPVGCLRLQGDDITAVFGGLVLLRGPVGVARLRPLLHHVAQHHDRPALELPNHLPEVVDGVWPGGLRGDVGITAFVALREGEKKVKVYVG